MIRTVLALLLAIVILPSEAATLPAFKDQQQKNVLGRGFDNRPVILARAVPSLYASGGTVPVLTYTFDPFVLDVGDLVRVSLWGLVINNNAGAVSLTCSATGLNALQGVASFNMGQGSLSIAAAAGNPNKYQFWRCDFLYAVAPPGATSQAYNYMPTVSAQAVTKGNTYSSGLQPLNNFGFYGGGMLLGTDSSGSGAVVSGGLLQVGAGGSSGLAMKTPVVCDNAVPTQINFSVGSAAAAFPITVLGGYIEGL